MPEKNLSAALELVHWPFSIGDSVDLLEDETTRDVIKTSNLYMLVSRPEVHIVKNSLIVGHERATLELEIRLPHGNVTGRFTLWWERLVDYLVSEFGYEEFDGELYAEIEENTLKLTLSKAQVDIEGTSADVVTYSADALLFSASGHKAWIAGPQNIRDFTTYNLLYVGISLEGSTFNRVLEKGHEKLQQILASEAPQAPGAQVRDEIMLLAFAVDYGTIRELNYGNLQEVVDGISGELSLTTTKIATSDIEKALINYLRPVYNGTKYKQYPEGSDGLRAAKYSGQGFYIRENITLKTHRGQLKGERRDEDDRGIFYDSGKADVLNARGDQKIFIQGADS